MVTMMATKQWTSQSGLSGAGDWFSTATSWIDANLHQYTSPPTAGDTAEIFTGSVSITAADATTPGRGTLDGITVIFTPAGGEATPTLDVSNEQFSSLMYLFTEAAPGLGGVLVTRGTVGFAGTLQSDFSGASLTLDIENQGGLATFTNTGTLKASNGSALSVTGAADAVLSSSGLLCANDASTLDIAVAVTSTSLGMVEALLQGVLDVTGPMTNLGTMLASELVGGLYDAGTIDITGSLNNAGSISDACFGTIAATGGVANSGTISNAGGVVTLGGGVANSGIITDIGGTLTITDSVSGTGTILVGDHVALDGAVGAGQVVSFGTATDATLDLNNVAAFAGTIANLTGHDVIDIAAAATATTYDATSHLLTVLNGTSAVAAFTVSGGATTLNATPDGMGGTVLTAEQIGTPTQVETYIVQNDANTYNSGTAMPHGWPTPATIYYSFDAGATLSASDESGFLRAMTLYEDIANISFATADATHPADLVITTNNADTADTSYTVTAAGITTVATSATISIDTQVAGWTDLSGLGTNDTSGYGGYGFLTVLHELGHAIGFGHPGPYNDGGVNADFLTSQIFYTDTRQYSVMSYIGGSQSGAVWTDGTTTIQPQTPMLYDIGAAQMIYGANTSVLAGNDTFGFNSSFAANSALSVYNFAVNTVPVVTLYDAGQNNTLDLSGFSAASYVNLNPGAFSSADGLTGNIGIAEGTTITTAIGGAGNDSFVVNAQADTIDGGGGANTAIFDAPSTDFQVAANAGTVTVTDTLTGVTDTLTNVQLLQFTDTVQLAPCFLRGTRILTARGELPVEALVAGEDRVVTREGRLAPVVWVGWRELDPMRHPCPADVMPVRVRAGALAPGQPQRDLLLSPDHALAIQGGLIPVRYLINGASIVQEEHGGRIAYFHVELDRHDILFAEGAAAESYLDTGNRAAFANGSAATALHPRFAPDEAAALGIWAKAGCLPLVIAGSELTEARAVLAARAAALGHRVTSDPDLHATADHRRLALRRRDGVWRATLPPGAGCLRLVSRAAVPLHLDGPGADARRLGVAVGALWLDREAVALDDARLGAGWHAPEAEFRWTDGAAEIDLRGARRLALRIALAGRYWRVPGEPVPRQVRC